ncbi:MAG TPA: fatty acid desaturase [Acetobacteraceae bacterium]|nr:fatty acid desaturase [Acetobacteraceae bacterium]
MPQTRATPVPDVPATADTLADRGTPYWRQVIAPYTKADNRKGAIQVLNTLLPFLGVMALLFAGIDHHIWVSVLLAPVAAGLLVRLFAIQHDCGHHSFFASRRVNDALGHVLATLTLTPYASWRRNHAVHHATSGNLDRRGIGDVTTVTVREYLALPWRRRMAYRLYRHPTVMFGVGPAYLFLVRLRLPMGGAMRGRQEWVSVLGTNATIALSVGLLAITVGVQPLLFGYLPVMLLAASAGVWLFYVQHQFEDAYWEPRPRWDFHAAAVEGCSFYDLPAPLHWFTGNIGFHHIHHLSSTIPNYRLRECHEAFSRFRQARRLTLLASLRCPRLALWDEQRRKLVSFRAIRQA